MSRTREEADKEKTLRYIYMLEIDNRGAKSKFYGQKKIYYTGETNNLGVRIKQHLMGINSKFLTENFARARKKVVFVKYFYGDAVDARVEEYRIKRLSQEKKKELILSDDNVLVSYRPLKFLILKSFIRDGSQEVIHL